MDVMAMSRGIKYLDMYTDSNPQTTLRVTQIGKDLGPDG